MRKQTILFLAANPSGTDQLALDREASAIQKELRGSGHRDRFEFEAQWAMEPHDLLPALREFCPTLVHFSGHGGGDGLVFHATDGGSQRVPIDAFAHAFGAAGASVKLVVLCNCYSDAQADALLAHVECVVGIGASMHRDAARIFAIGFYGALGDGASVAAAYESGAASIQLEGLPDSARPQIKVRSDTSAGLVPAVFALADPGSCPYPGMQPYSADTAQYFHGRDAKIDELIGRLRLGEREIYVIGPSGSGKSSLVAAGVLPRLVGGGVSGPGPFVVRSMRPGDHPIARMSESLGVCEGGPITAPADAIAAELAHRAPSAAVLFVIDQLEEVFTQANPDERVKFFAALQAMRTVRRCVVIFTLRADFFGALMESPLWTDQISRVEIGPLRGEELREAIERPARTLGGVVEPALTERLSGEAASEPGILPLLQDILVQLWDLGRVRMLASAEDRATTGHARIDLTCADYAALSVGDRSGLAVALAKRANATLDALTPAQHAIARRIMLRLVSFGEGRSDTRRQQPRSKLRDDSDNAGDFDAVLRRLTDDRLLTMDDSEYPDDALVDLAHEVMTTAWPTLERWVKTRRADELRRRQFEETAARWKERGRGLLDPVELAEVEAWRRTESARELGVSADLTALVVGSRAAARRRRRRLVGGVAVVAVLAAFAFQRAREAHVERKRRESSEQENNHRLALSYQETGRQLLLEGHPLKALPYLVAARKSGEEGATLRMLYWAASRYLLITPPLVHQGDVASAVFSPDGARIVTASADNTARIWNAATGEQLKRLEHGGEVRSAEFSSDGTRIVTASADDKARIWDAATGKQLAILEHAGSRQGDLPGRSDTATDPRKEVRSAVFSPGGGYVLTAGDDGTARLWDAATGQPFSKPLRHKGNVQSAVFNRDGTRIVTASDDKTARVWDATTGIPVSPPLEHRGAVRAAAFSPDGSRVVTVSVENTAHVWDAASGRYLAALEHHGTVVSAAFSPDGARILTASDGKTAHVWDAMTGKLLVGPLEHQGKVLGVAFSPDGSRIVTASADHMAHVWDAQTGKPLARPLEHQGAVRSAMFSSDGTRIVTASSDQTARVWDAQTNKSLAHKRAVHSAAFSPDGTRVVTASSDHATRVWEVATGRLVRTLSGEQGIVNSAAFSPNGTRIVTAVSDDRPGPAQGSGSPPDFKGARVWDADTGTPLSSLVGHRGVVWSAAFSPDGTRLVTASADMTARIWNASTGNPTSPPLVHGGVVWSAVFSPDGAHVVTASGDHMARIWDVTSGNQCTHPLEHHDEVRTATFSPDGQRIVTSSWDGSAQIWDAATGQPLFPPLQHRDIVRSAAFSADNTRVVTASDDTTARVWDARTGNVIAVFLEHRATVWSAAFNHDGTKVVTASADGTARVWDAATGKVLATLEHQGGVRSAMFSVDGRHVITVGNGNTAHIWEIRLDQTLEQWFAAAELSPFVLSNDGILQPRVPRSLGRAGSRFEPPPIDPPYPSLDR